MASIKFSSIFEVVAASEEEVLSLKAQAELIGEIRDMATKNGWSHIEACAEGNRILINQAKSQVNDNRLIEGLDSHTAHADELRLLLKRPALRKTKPKKETLKYTRLKKLSSGSLA